MPCGTSRAIVVTEVDRHGGPAVGRRSACSLQSASDRRRRPSRGRTARSGQRRSRTGCGGIRSIASSRSSATSPSMSSCSNASTYRSSSSRSAGAGGGQRRRGQLVLDRRAGALQRAVDRRHGRLEDLGDLWRGPPEHVPEDRGPRAGVPGSSWMARSSASSMPSRMRVPGGRVVCRRRGLVQRQVRERVDRLRPARAALQLVQARVGRDPVQPGLKLGPRLEPLQRPPRPQQRLLDDVLGSCDGAEHPVAVHLERVPVRLDQLAKRPLVTGLGRGQEQALIGGAPRISHGSHPVKRTGAAKLIGRLARVTGRGRASIVVSHSSSGRGHDS